MVQNGLPYLSIKKIFRWTARVRTWSSPPSSARTSSILLDAPFSKCQGLTQKYYGPTIQPTTLTTPTNPSTQQTYPPTPPITFNHEGGVPQKSSENKNGPEWSPLLVRKKNSGGQQEEGHGVVHHLQQEHHQSYLMHHFQNARG